MYKYIEQFFNFKIHIKMKYNAMIKRLQRRGFTEQGIASMVAARKKKAAENLAREAVYLGILNKERVHKYLAYEHRQLIKEGRRESCKQRKRRLRKEYLANKRAA
jgi:hypothetical protein